MDNQKNKRRPSGFATAGQARRPGPAPDAKKKATYRQEEKKVHKPKKEKKARVKREAPARKPRRILKVLSAIAAVLLAIFILILLIFGGEDTVHQMPTIERRNISSFTAENTPLPGAEVS